LVIRGTLAMSFTIEKRKGYTIFNPGYEIGQNQVVHRRTASRVFKWKPHWRSSVTTAVIQMRKHHRRAS
jgi:hypothetical protein